MMRRLSISRAWDETKEVLGRDGQLFISVALALIALPVLISGLVNPRSATASPANLVGSLVGLVAVLITLAGQLAMIRLALAPSITVGEAIVHGVRRMPIYFLAALLIFVGFLIAAIPFGVVLAVLGVPMEQRVVTATPPVVIATLLYFALICYFGVRMAMSAPVASAEPVGPIEIIRRSWELTKGNFWRLLSFLILYFIAVLAVLIGADSALGALLALALGPMHPLSIGALLLGIAEAVLNSAVTVVLSVMVARIYAQLVARGETIAGVPISGT